MPSWKNPASGLWLDPVNWNGGVPNAPGAVAEFTVTAPASSAFFQALLGQDATVTVGTLTIVTDSTTGRSISGANGTANSRLVFQGATGSPAFLNVDTNGSVRSNGFSPFGFRMTFASDVIVTTQDSDTTVQMFADVDGTGDLYKFGAGTLKFGGNNANWLGDANLSGGRTEVFQVSNLNQAYIRLDNHAVLAATSSFTLANDIEVGPRASTGTIAAAGITLTLASRLIVSSNAQDAVTLGTATDTGTILLTGRTLVSGTGGFVIAGPSVRLGNADVAADYFSTLAPQGLVRITGQLDTGGFAAHLDNLVLDEGSILSVGGALNLVVDDETNSSTIQQGFIGATAGADQVVVNALTNFNFRGVTFSGWTNGVDTITINGSAVGNSLTGGDQNDIINGNAGNDTLIGMGGADILTGGTGNDTYRIGDALDTLVEKPGEGVDTIVILPGGPTSYTLPAEFENLTFENSAKNTGFGNAAANTLIGGLSDDILNGLGGADIMEGKGGNDSYFVDDAADQVIEQIGPGGTDQIFASVSYALAAGTAVETLSTTNAAGSGAIGLTGNEFGQTLIGNAGANFLDGGGGADILNGGAGDDTIIVDSDDVVIEAIGGGNDLVAARTSYALNAGAEVETLSTINSFSTAAIGLTGNAFGQTLIGNAGANFLDGGGGADILNGGAGNDTIIVDSDDQVVEAGGGGNDLVAAKTSYALNAGAEVETLSTINSGGNGAIGLTGNEFGQTIIGNVGNNFLDGGGGADILQGLGGNDTIIVDSDDVVIEAIGGGNDLVAARTSYALNAGAEVETLSTINSGGNGAIGLTGNEFAQTIIGNAGANFLDGGGGADILNGGAGNDTIIVDSDDLVVEAAGGGNDLVAAKTSYALNAGAEVETLSTINSFSNAAIGLTGNAFAQTIIGNIGNNFLDGGGGADILNGGGGNDTIIVDSDDQVIEAAGGGNDLVAAKTSYALNAGAEVETLSTINSFSNAAIGLTGNEFGQTLIGNIGNNFLDGGGGADVLNGGAGNDTYIVDNAGDQVIEAAGGGSDLVASGTSYALGAGVEVETLSTTFGGGNAAINLTGNEFAQTLIGNAGNNVLNGGLGADTLQGLGGADTFGFTTALGGGNVDAITDFVRGTDRMALDDAIFGAGIGAPGANANAFVVGTAAGDADDRIIYNSATGQLFYDADGNGAGAAVLFATLQGAPTLSAADFQVI